MTRLNSMIDVIMGAIQSIALSPPILAGVFPSIFICLLAIDDFGGFQLPPCRALPQYLYQLV